MDEGNLRPRRLLSQEGLWPFLLIYLLTNLNFTIMKKLVMMFVIIVAPFAFTACTDDADDVQPVAVEADEVESTEGEDVDDR